MTKVSVIIPIYGVELFIERCSRSLLEQTMKDDIEFIFVNDCTKDNSISILQNIIAEYPGRRNQVKIINHDKNYGLPIARQTGLKVAKGEYVLHCDSDDWVDVNMCKNMYDTAKKEEADIVVCDINVVSQELTKCRIGLHNYERDAFINDMLYRKVSWVVWNKLVRRSLYEKVEKYPTSSVGEDVALVIQLIFAAKKISYCNMPYYSYRLNDLSMTRTVDVQKVRRNFHQAIDNTTIVLDFFHQQKCHQFDKALEYLKYHGVSTIISNLKYSEDFKRWRYTYPNVFKNVLKDRNVNFKDRLKCLLVITHLYILLVK